MEKNNITSFFHADLKNNNKIIVKKKKNNLTRTTSTQYNNNSNNNSITNSIIFNQTMDNVEPCNDTVQNRDKPFCLYHFCY